jgi:protoporphyrinogen oxidase
MTENLPAGSQTHVGILGGGIAGLTAAFYLLRSGIQVTVVEARPQLGGLSTYFDFGPFHWDKFYHCVLTSDRPLQQLIADLGLSEELRWRETKVGFYAASGLYSVSSSLEFLKFPLLSLWEKFRFGLGIIYASRIRDGLALESVLVSDWLIKIFGKGCYEKMWAPLLKCKLGSCREEASAAFIWATIARLYSTRDRDAGQKERLGYVRGGYRTVFSRLIQDIERMGGKLVTGVPVKRIESRADGGIDFVTEDGALRFDRAVVTSPSHVAASLVPELSAEYARNLKAIKYLGIVCVALVLKRSLSPFYVTNLTTNDVPFTGVIEMTNLVSLEETAGRHLIYLPKYIAPGDPLFESNDEQVWDLFWGDLQKMFPDLVADDIERKFIFREKLVQPLPVLHYSDLVPSMETGVPNLFLANTTQIINSTLNNNEMVKIALKATDLVLRSAPQDAAVRIGA